MRLFFLIECRFFSPRALVSIHGIEAHAQGGYGYVSVQELVLERVEAESLGQSKRHQWRSLVIMVRLLSFANIKRRHRRRAPWG